ncbi:MAG: polyhydroxyalkanoate synthesis regulator DNA-binding domain-containing protein [Deltaproteobacteria bacterium]|nr:polyhydroxyalkanoate synthesis regulator DNA-binding domain-containing protein [Deltaproteobacteria bacterium]
MCTKDLRIIKRYPNRKLYDTTDSTYITLKEIGELVKNGEMVQIIENSSGEDLTHDFLLQIIRNQEKKWKIFPLKSLVELIRSQANSTNEIVNSVKREVDQKVNDFPKMNDLREKIDMYQVKFEEWQKNVEMQIHSIIEFPGALISKEVEILRDRLIKLEQKVSDLKSKLDKKD